MYALMCSVRFRGETDVVDEGGVTRELFNLGARLVNHHVQCIPLLWDLSVCLSVCLFAYVPVNN
jgi:hypothetical protein